jgi:hypothetical protein
MARSPIQWREHGNCRIERNEPDQFLFGSSSARWRPLLSIHNPKSLFGLHRRDLAATRSGSGSFRIIRKIRVPAVPDRVEAQQGR